MPVKRRIITQAWIERAKAVLDARGRGSRAALARKVGCDRAQISQLLRGDYDASEFVEAISDELGLVLPPEDISSPIVRELIDVVSQLDDEQVSDLMRIAERIAGIKPTSE